MQALREIYQFITAHPNASAQYLYDQKEVELISKYGLQLVAKFVPEFESRDATIFKVKNKSVPVELLDLSKGTSHVAVLNLI